MPVEALSLALLVLLVVGALVVVFAVVRHAPRARGGAALASGDFSAALESSLTDGDADCDELRAAAIAAKHLLLFERAATLLDRALDLDPNDGESWLERGLVAAYSGDLDSAEQALSRAGRLRSDLAESISLHRAWVALRGGREDDARRLFEEIEAPLESKLFVDLGPGDPLFSEWFLQAADLWWACGRRERAERALREGLDSAGESRLGEIIGPVP